MSACAVDNCRVPGRHHASCRGTYLTQPCGGCLPGEEGDYMLICRHHYRRAVIALHELPELDEALTLASVRSSPSAQTERVTAGNVEHGIKLNDAVMATKDSLRKDPSLFASYVIVEYGAAPLTSQTTSDMVSVIDRHSLGLAADPVTAKAFATKIPSARADARRHAYPDKATTLKLCACPQCGRAIRYTRDDKSIRCRGATWTTSLTSSNRTSPHSTGRASRHANSRRSSRRARAS